MRIWHTDLIPILPRQQLVSQWKELGSIFVDQVNHRLINFVYDYGKEHLLLYTNKIIDEFERRGYKINSFINCYNYFKDCRNVPPQVCFPNKMTKRYLMQCLLNLQEKYDSNAITQDEWNKLETILNEVYDET